VQLVAPVEAWNFPTAQTEHALAPSAENWPAVQSKQLEAPLVPIEVPAAHFMHAVEPAAEEANMPPAHI